VHLCSSGFSDAYLSSGRFRVRTPRAVIRRIHLGHAHRKRGLSPFRQKTIDRGSLNVFNPLRGRGSWALFTACRDCNAFAAIGSLNPQADHVPSKWATQSQRFHVRKKLLPPHGRMACASCFNGKVVWGKSRDPGAWGAQKQPLVCSLSTASKSCLAGLTATFQPGTTRKAAPLKSSYGTLRVSAARRTFSRAAASVAPQPRGAAPSTSKITMSPTPAMSVQSANDF
jgi:hypothetical protein